jgi:membrane-associated phospholipid phosphatase
MPSLHFATSLMGAHLLSDIGPLAGAVGWAYAVTLGVALVYLGEHYAIDLVGGALLTETVRAMAPRLEPVAARLSAALQALEERASLA